MSDFELEGPAPIRVVHVRVEPPPKRPRPQAVTLRDGVHDALPIGGSLTRDRALVINFVDWAERPRRDR